MHHLLSRAPFVAATLFVLSVAVAARGGAQHQHPPAGGAHHHPEAAKLKNPVAANAASIEAGKTVYLRSCKFCHAEDAKGDGPQKPKDSHPSDLTDAKWDRGSTDGEIFAVIRNGAGPKFEMKPNKILKDDDIWNIVNYLRSIGPKTATKK